jgi:UDP-N-acetyl-2-amino-2-deoxyglucuronate dehydrogenase
MAREQLALGFVGCGGIARAMAWLVRLNPGLRIAACMSPVPGEAEGFAKKFRIPRVYTDLASLGADPDVRAWYLASPHDAHAPQLGEAIGRGIPVLCEKPLATTLEDGIDACARARAAGVKVAVNYQYRYERGCRELIDASRAGEFGDILFASCTIPWHREAGYFAGTWRASRQRSGGGTLITQGSHLLDVLLCAAGGRPVRAWGSTARRKFADIEVEDLAMGCVETDTGCLLSITSSAAATPERPATIEIYGSRATALWTASSPSRLRVLGTRARGPRPHGGTASGIPPVRGVHAAARSMEAFRRWVAHGEEPLHAATSTLPVLAAVTAIYASAREGRRIDVPTLAT